jgi:hypothetical protein
MEAQIAGRIISKMGDVAINVIDYRRRPPNTLRHVVICSDRIIENL